jgi:hypothetical protein
MKTILLIMLLAVSASAQGIQPQYPVGATMTRDQFELNFCVAQHWLSQSSTSNLGFHINFIGKWTDDQKVEFGERCAKIVRDRTLVAASATTSAITDTGTTSVLRLAMYPLPIWRVRAWVNGMPVPEVSK